MSVSKLESLPNEILIDLLEKYVNGVDLFVAFGNHLNRRFDALVDQCQQLHLDFERIRKNHFHLCLGFLPDYRDRIYSLTLSERDTPGQIHAFLSFFPTFDQFKQLRRLRLDFDGNTVEEILMKNAMRSLFKTNVQTLSIKGKNAHVIFHWNHINEAIFNLTTIRQLFLAVDTHCWKFQRLTSFNIEHLTIEGHGCTWNTLKTILKCAPRLSYLNARVAHHTRYSDQVTIVGISDIQPLTKLKTLILKFIDDYNLITLNIVVQYLHLMPHLHQLEMIDTHWRFLDTNVWQMCLQKLLPFLTHFSLKIDRSLLTESDLHDILTSFQTPFWIELKSVNIYTIRYEDVDGDVIAYYYPISSRFYLNDYPESEGRLRSFWTIPRRCVKDSRLLVQKLTTLHLSKSSSFFPIQYYLNNVKHLKVDHLNSSLFKWIITYIDLVHLRELLIPHLQTERDEINSLLTRAKNLSLLQIHFNQLFGKRSARMGEHKFIRRLDISVAEHRFRQENILVLARLFPSIEHLKINTNNLDTVPLLNVYLPKLHSLTFKLANRHFGKFRYYQLRNQTQFLFKCTGEWLTIWLDQSTFQERFWQPSRTTHH